jgi:hypothetical protein
VRSDTGGFTRALALNADDGAGKHRGDQSYENTPELARFRESETDFFQYDFNHERAGILPVQCAKGKPQNNPTEDDGNAFLKERPLPSGDRTTRIGRFL